MIRPLDPLEQPDLLGWLQDWYCGNCDGVWEHSFGVKIDTLDNPGWKITVDLTGTPLADKQPESSMGPREITGASESDWICFEITERQFIATCGPQTLAKALDLFRAFATSAD